MASRLEDALDMCNKIGGEPGNHVDNIRSLNSFDGFMYIQYNGYVCVNELYEDDEGFNKNSYMYGKMVYANGTKFVEDVEDLDGLSSNSYASWNEAEISAPISSAERSSIRGPPKSIPLGVSSVESWIRSSCSSIA